MTPTAAPDAEALARAQMTCVPLAESGQHFGTRLTLTWTTPWVQGVGYPGVQQTMDDAVAVMNWLAAKPVTALAGGECSYCSNGKLTGLPGNACENCMNTGLVHPGQSNMPVPAVKILRDLADSQWRAALQVEESDPPLFYYRKGSSRAYAHAADILSAPPPLAGDRPVDMGLSAELKRRFRADQWKRASDFADGAEWAAARSMLSPKGEEALLTHHCRVDGRNFAPGQPVQQVIGRAHACYDRWAALPTTVVKPDEVGS